MTRLVEAMRIQARIVISRQRPDVLYVRAHFAALPGVVWARARNVPVILELNGPSGSVLSSWPRARLILPILTAMMRLQLRLSTAIIGGNEGLLESAAERGASRSFLVPNGADTDLFRPDAPSDRELPDRFVCFTGALADWQGVEQLLQALDDPEWPSGVVLVVIGDGALEEVVATAARRRRDVSYLGRLPQREVPGILARSMAALSLRHGFGVVPLKLIEAMACGVPVIATAIAGQEEIVSAERCGILVPEGDPGSIAKAVSSLSTDPDLAKDMGRRGREATLARYSWDHAAELTHQALNQVMSASDAPSDG